MKLIFQDPICGASRGWRAAALAPLFLLPGRSVSNLSTAVASIAADFPTTAQQRDYRLRNQTISALKVRGQRNQRIASHPPGSVARAAVAPAGAEKSIPIHFRASIAGPEFAYRRSR